MSTILLLVLTDDLERAKHFGRALRDLRLARGLSLNRLAIEAGVDAGHISRFENFDRLPTKRSAILLANGLGLTGDERFNFMAYAGYVEEVVPYVPD